MYKLHRCRGVELDYTCVPDEVVSDCMSCCAVMLVTIDHARRDFSVKFSCKHDIEHCLLFVNWVQYYLGLGISASHLLRLST